MDSAKHNFSYKLVHYDIQHPRQYMECIYQDGYEHMPVLIWIHGGAWDDERLTTAYRHEPTITRLVQEGFFVACIEYRLTRHAVLPAGIEDCQKAIEYLWKHAKEYGIDSEKIVLWGESAGAHLACMVASDFNNRLSIPIQGVISFYCPSDLLAQVAFTGGKLGFVVNALPEGELSEEEIEDILRKESPIFYADKENLPPFLLMHGDQDEVVDYHESIVYAEKLWAAGNQAELVLVPGQGHGFFEGQEYYDKVIAAIKGFVTDL